MPDDPGYGRILSDLRLTDHQDRLGRGDVVAGRQVGGLGLAEESGDEFRGKFDNETTAHELSVAAIIHYGNHIAML